MTSSNNSHLYHQTVTPALYESLVFVGQDATVPSVAHVKLRVMPACQITTLVARVITVLVPLSLLVVR